jgi:hypothetical protein
MVIGGEGVQLVYLCTPITLVDGINSNIMIE